MRGSRRSRDLVARQLRPTPRIALGLGLVGVARSAADISDGLVRDALHVAGPGCTVVLDAARLPVQVGADVGQALAGGEDFELVVAVPPSKVNAAMRVGYRCGVPLTVVGEVVRGTRPRLIDAPPRLPEGFDHFR
jgi:thiamine-monophosphate kinase